jgi:hypothetical protein
MEDYKSNTIEQLIKQAKVLAKRWVDAWTKSSGYGYVDDIVFDCNNNITFMAHPITSGMGKRCVISSYEN